MNGSPPAHRDRSGSGSRRRSFSRSRSRSRSRKYNRGYEGGGRGGGGGGRGYRSRSRSRGGRSHSRSPMSSRRRHTTNRVSPPPSSSYGGHNRHPSSRAENVRGSSRFLQDNPGPNKCLGVFGLSLRTTERDLREVFSRYGPIEECTVVIDAQTGRSRGFAFIYYESMEDAKAAKDSCNGIEIDNRRIRVDFSITQRAHTPTPGIYMGKPTMDGKPRRRRDDYRGYRRSPSPYYRRSHYRPRYSRSRSYSPRK